MNEKSAGLILPAWLRARWMPVCVFASLAILFYPGLTTHFHHGTAFQFFQDDMLQQIVPYLRFYTPGTFVDYYPGDYFMACMPLGFHALMRSVASFMDPTVFAVHLPYLLYAAFLVGMGRAAYRLGGWACCWLTLAFCLCADVYLDRMSGGLARGFGFPIIGLGLAALVQGRIGLLMAVIIGGALFYPSAAVPLGMAMALLLFVCPDFMRGQARGWGFKKRFALLALTGGLAAAFILPTALRIGPYGPSITPRDVEAFPESGPGGRYQEDERAPFPGFMQSSSEMAPAFMFTLGRFDSEKTGFTGQPFSKSLRDWGFEKNYKGEVKRKKRFLSAAYVLGILGGLGLLVKSRDRRSPWLRLLLLPLCAGLAYQIARVAAPYFYLPERYVVFPIPPFMALFIAAGLCGLPQWLGRWQKSWQPVVSALVLGGLLLAVFGGRGTERAGLFRKISEEDHLLYEKVGGLDESAVVAGWPKTAINYMPLFARRTPFLTFELHQAFHQAYALEMRSRMQALMAAYYATDLDEVLKLRDEFEVDVLLLDKRDFRRRPNYFNPFGKEMSRLFHTEAKASLAFWKTCNNAVVGRSGPYLLIDLHAL